MAIHELNQTEIREVSGALTLSLGTSTFSLDLNDLLGDALGSVNTLIDDVQTTLGGLLAQVPVIPAITIPGLGLTIGLTIA